jgi:hypothetical protein
VLFGRNYVYYWILRGYKEREEAGNTEEGLAFILEAPKCVVIGRNYVYYWIMRGYKEREEAADTEEGLAFILEATKCVVIGRNYVYYWILRGYKGREEAEDTEEEGGLAVASLYSLTYAHKQAEIEAEEGSVALYTGQLHLCYRFHSIRTKRQCCGSGMFIPDPKFSIPDLGSKRHRIRNKGFKHFIPNNCYLALGNMIWDVYCGFRIRIRNTKGNNADRNLTVKSALSLQSTV